MDRLILADIQALAASSDYGGLGLIQSSSAALGLSAALFLSDLDLWQGASYSLTDAEIDDIQAMIAQLENDLINAGDLMTVYNCKLTNSVDFEVLDATWALVTFDTEIYDPSGMHSIVSETYKINVIYAGLYLLGGQIVWPANTIGTRYVYLYKYDTALGYAYILSRYFIGATSPASPITVPVAIQDSAVPGDYYYIRVYQNSGVALDLPSGVDYLNFAVAGVS